MVMAYEAYVIHYASSSQLFSVQHLFCAYELRIQGQNL